MDSQMPDLDGDVATPIAQRARYDAVER